MSINHIERFDPFFRKYLKGYILVNKGHFQRFTSEKHTDKFNRVQREIYYIFEGAFYDDETNVIYENKDKKADMVYIHNASLLGFPSHNTFVDSKRLDKDGVTLDISGLSIPDSEDVLSNIGKNIPHFPFETTIPNYTIESLSDKLDKLDILDDQKKLISIALFSEVYGCSYDIRSAHNIDNTCRLENIKGIYSLEQQLGHLKEGLDEIISLAGKYKINVKEKIIDCIMKGAYYSGIKTYTKDEILAMHETCISNIDSYNIFFYPMDAEAKHIPVKIRRHIVSILDTPTHDEYYTNPYIKDIPFLVNWFLSTE